MPHLGHSLNPSAEQPLVQTISLLHAQPCIESLLYSFSFLILSSTHLSHLLCSKSEFSVNIVWLVFVDEIEDERSGVMELLDVRREEGGLVEEVLGKAFG